MAHDIHRMIDVGEMPWHGLGVRLPARASYEEIVQTAAFYGAVEKDVYVPPFRTPIPDRKALVSGDTGEYLAVVARGYEVVQFSEVARSLVEAARDRPDGTGEGQEVAVAVGERAARAGARSR